jgi:hypothetical protein
MPSNRERQTIYMFPMHTLENHIVKFPVHEQYNCTLPALRLGVIMRMTTHKRGNGTGELLERTIGSNHTPVREAACIRVGKCEKWSQQIGHQHMVRFHPGEEGGGRSH